MAINVEPSAFKAWLEGQPDGTVFGDPKDCWSIPITRYMQETMGINSLCLSAGEYVYYDARYRVHQETAPDWAVAHFMLLTFERIGEMTKEDALRVLAVVMRT